jgi:hypothetical protein
LFDMHSKNISATMLKWGGLLKLELLLQFLLDFVKTLIYHPTVPATVTELLVF